MYNVFEVNHKRNIIVLLLFHRFAQLAVEWWQEIAFMLQMKANASSLSFSDASLYHEHLQLMLKLSHLRA